MTYVVCTYKYYYCQALYRIEWTIFNQTSKLLPDIATDLSFKRNTLFQLRPLYEKQHLENKFIFPRLKCIILAGQRLSKLSTFRFAKGSIY